MIAPSIATDFSTHTISRMKTRDEKWGQSAESARSLHLSDRGTEILEVLNQIFDASTPVAVSDSGRK